MTHREATEQRGCHAVSRGAFRCAGIRITRDNTPSRVLVQWLSQDDELPAVVARGLLSALRCHPTSIKGSFPQHHTAVDPQHLAGRVSIGH